MKTKSRKQAIRSIYTGRRGGTVLTSALHWRAITAGSRGFVDSRHIDCAGAAEVSYVYYTRKTFIRYDCNGEEDFNVALLGIRHFVP